jgi:hypothetical protein
MLDLLSNFLAVRLVCRASHSSEGTCIGRTIADHVDKREISGTRSECAHLYSTPETRMSIADALPPPQDMDSPAPSCMRQHA